jgi:hypothetical protein
MLMVGRGGRCRRRRKSKRELGGGDGEAGGRCQSCVDDGGKMSCG